MLDLIHTFLADEEGSTSIEYALIAALMAIVSIEAARALGDNMSSTWTMIAEALDDAVQAAPP